MSNSQNQLTTLESQALRRAINRLDDPHWRESFFKQMNTLLVQARTEKTVGYYVDFLVQKDQRIENLPDDFNKRPMSAEANHPDGKNGIFFLVYVKDGMLSFMELSSTDDWPKDESKIVFVD
jgi:hypothetical protein